MQRGAHRCRSARPGRALRRLHHSSRLLRKAAVNVPAARLVFSDDDRAAILSMIDESLRTGSLPLGPRTIELEEGFRARHGAPYAVAVSSGTSALEIILRAIGV